MYKTTYSEDDGMVRIDQQNANGHQVVVLTKRQLNNAMKVLRRD